MKPIALVFNDVHLKTGNEEDILSSVEHMIIYALKSGIKKVIFAGDLFDNRAFQRQAVLETFDIILEKFNTAGIHLYLFPGNHDKTLYSGAYSFLDVYRYHPNVTFNRELKNIEIEGVKITLLPFFADEQLIPMIEAAEGGDILISHFEMAGSSHLGQVSEKTSITRTMLKKWKKTYLGHYHNTHEISKNIVHLPSFRQSSFGEDNNKGFTILYDDFSYEIVRGKFKEFTKIVIDIDTTSTIEIKALIKLHKNSENIIRFELIGEESKLKALDKEQFKETGIDIKVKYQSTFDSSKIEMPKLIKKYDEAQVTGSFKAFCFKKGYDYEQGLKFLKEFLTKKDVQ